MKKMTEHLFLFRSRRPTLFALAFSLLFWGMNFTGRSMQEHMAVPWSAAAFCWGMALLLAVPTAEIYLRLHAWLLKKRSLKAPAAGHELHCWLIYAAAHFLCLLPVFLAYYPGVFAYDVFIELTQTAGSYTTLHPLAHTLLLHFFYDWLAPRIGGPTNAMAVYTLLQMAAFSMLYAYVHLVLRRLGMPKGFRLAVLIFTCVHPVFTVLVISITKDIMFTAFFAVLLAGLVQWELLPERMAKPWELLLYAVSLCGAALFRNNGVYAIAIMLVCAVLRFHKRPWFRRFLLVSMAGLAAFFCLQNGMKYAVKAEPGPKNEALSIPYQQLAYTYTVEKDTLTAQQQAAIEDMIPHLQYFTVFSADEAKYLAKGEDDLGSLMSLWADILPGHLKSYIEAVLHTTMGYWYIFDKTNANIYPHPPEDRYGFLQTATTPFLGVEHTSYLVPLETLYERLFSYNEYQLNPVSFLLCSPALYAWLIILLLFWSLEDCCGAAAVPLTLVLALILTLFAGPCVLIRYAFPYIACLPLLWAAWRKGMAEKAAAIPE